MRLAGAQPLEPRRRVVRERDRQIAPLESRAKLDEGVSGRKCAGARCWGDLPMTPRPQRQEPAKPLEIVGDRSGTPSISSSARYSPSWSRVRIFGWNNSSCSTMGLSRGGIGRPNFRLLPARGRFLGRHCQIAPYSGLIYPRYQGSTTVEQLMPSAAARPPVRPPPARAARAPAPFRPSDRDDRRSANWCDVYFAAVAGKSFSTAASTTVPAK
jgi:hypothetical protein